MRRSIIIISLLTASLGISGCQQAKKSLGFEKRIPDEFKVISNAPLTVPPDFELRPPEPGARPRTRGKSIDQQAKDLLIKNVDTSDQQATQGEAILLQRANTADADPNIRKALEEEQRSLQQVEEEQGVVDKILSFTRGEDATPKDPIVDAQKEKERVMKQKQDGEAVDGSDTPVIEEKPNRNLLKRVFDWL